MVSKSLAAALLLAAPVSGDRVRITPVQKVLDMLTGMKGKGTTMMDMEKATFVKYTEWVDDQSKDLGFQVKTGETKIEELLAYIQKTNSDVKQHGNAIAKLDSDISRMEGEKNDATAVRDDERAEYAKVETDYSESIDALARAIQTMKSQDYSRPQAEAFLQRMAKSNTGMRRVFAAFLQMQEQDKGNGAPAVAAYENQSGGIIEMLEGLYKKFKAELDDAETAEGEQAHTYDLTMLHLSDTIKKSNSDRSERAAAKGEGTAASANAVGELAETRKSLAEDKTFRADMKAEFSTKSSTFEANQKVRAEELTAIGKAIEIMSGKAASAGYEKHINLAQVPKSATAFLQKSTTERRVAMRQRAVDLLKTRAKALSSRDLSALVAKMEASPFAKVIDMVETLLAKLKQEAQEEAAHKDWCDKQLKDNKLKREKKTAGVERLSAEVEDLDGQIASMAEDIDTLTKDQSSLTKAISEATSQRTAEKKENTATIADAAAGKEAVKSALVVLREFYDNQAALLQGSSKQAPEIEAYSGMSSAKGGVVGMMEVIESDFARLEADTKAAEHQGASEYDSFMADAKADKKQKHEAEVKTRLKKDQAEFERSNTKKDLVEVEKELSGANKYYEGLKPSCLEVHVSFEERVAKRKEEIQSLKDAYKMLDAKA